MDEPIKKAWIKGKPVVSEMDEFLENFRGGGEVVSDPKKFRCNFFCIRNCTFGHEFQEKIATFFPKKRRDNCHLIGLNWPISKNVTHAGRRITF